MRNHGKSNLITTMSVVGPLINEDAGAIHDLQRLIDTYTKVVDDIDAAANLRALDQRFIAELPSHGGLKLLRWVCGLVRISWNDSSSRKPRHYKTSLRQHTKTKAHNKQTNPL